MKLHQKRLLYAGLIVLLVVIWIFYAANGPQTTAVLAGTVRAATLLALGAMCGMIGERSGVVNIGIEGQFLLSAFAAFTVASMTSSLFLGTIAGIGMGLLMGWMLAAMAVGLKVDQIIAGTVLNIAALGLTSFFYDRSRSLGMAAADDDRRTRCCEHGADGGAHPRGASGDERHLSFEIDGQTAHVSSSLFDTGLPAAPAGVDGDD